MPQYELAAVCTSKHETAMQAKEFYGAGQCFDNYVSCANSAGVDAISVSVSVPGHHSMIMAGLDAAKHCFCEWPLGRNTAQAVEMAEKARAKNVRTCCGLQARGIPELLRLRELLQEGFLGQLLSANLRSFAAGALQRGRTTSWMSQDENGANTLTISSGHLIDIFRYVLGDFEELSANLTTQIKEWETPAKFADNFRSPDPNPPSDAAMVPRKDKIGVTSPDTIMLQGTLLNGAAASIHISQIPWNGQGCRLEIYGTEGTIVVEAPRPALRRSSCEHLVLPASRGCVTRWYSAWSCVSPSLSPVVVTADPGPRPGTGSTRAVLGLLYPVPLGR